MDCKARQSKSEEAAQCHVELNRLYDFAKANVESIKLGSAREDRKQFVADVKESQRLLRSIQTKINYLKTVAKEVPTAAEKRTVDTNVTSHEKQLGQLQRKFREYSEEVEREMAQEERNSLLMSREEGVRERKPMKTANHQERSARLQDIVAQMSRTVDSGEQAMSSLVHSSSVLGQTQSEYENQKGHIQTGSKLLSKYEQREFTEKILLVFFFLFYFGVVYYILQKRVLLRFWIF